MQGHTDYIRTLAFVPNSTTLVSGSDDNTIRLWDIDTGNQLALLTGHTDNIFAVAISPDGTILASCSADGTLRLWNANTGHRLTVLKGHTEKIYALHFRRMVESSPARVGMEQFDYGIHIIVNISQPLQQSHSVFHTLILFYPDPVDAVRKPHHRRQFKERTRLSSRNSRASYIQRKEARELRDYKR